MKLPEFFEGPESLPANLMVYSGIIGAIIGLIIGFSNAGIGGAIAGILGGGIAGALGGGFLFIISAAFVFLLPWILIIGGLALAIFLISSLWGVGRP